MNFAANALLESPTRRDRSVFEYMTDSLVTTRKPFGPSVGTAMAGASSRILDNGVPRAMAYASTDSALEGDHSEFEDLWSGNDAHYVVR